MGQFLSEFMANYESGGDTFFNLICVLVMLAWYVLVIVQMFLAYGTAYRKAKANGDNGVSLFGWLIVYELAALVPYLGFYLWGKSKDTEPNESESE